MASTFSHMLALPLPNRTNRWIGCIPMGGVASMSPCLGIPGYRNRVQTWSASVFKRCSPEAWNGLRAGVSPSLFPPIFQPKTRSHCDLFVVWLRSLKAFSVFMWPCRIPQRCIFLPPRLEEKCTHRQWLGLHQYGKCYSRCLRIVRRDRKRSIADEFGGVHPFPDISMGRCSRLPPVNARGQFGEASWRIT